MPVSGNHIFLQLVGDGDPHTLIRPDTIRPSTATELLEHILARDDTPQSASTLVREQQDPVVRLGVAVKRSLDALHMAAEEIVGPSEVQALEGFADRLSNRRAGMAGPACQLLLLAVDGADPQQRLQAAHDAREISSADDRAAALDWRLGNTSLLRGRDGPLPWLPSIPHRIAANPTWPYLNARSDLVAQLADEVRRNAAADPPAWTRCARSSWTCRSGV
jgi:hypothetical protein